MNESGESIVIETVPMRSVAEALRGTRTFAEVDPLTALGGMERMEKVHAAAGAVLVAEGEPWRHYWIVLAGETRAERPEKDGSWSLVGRAQAGDGFGEVPLLAGRKRPALRVLATKDSVLVRIGEREFWGMMAGCETTRKVIVADMAQRLEAHQVEALHRQKMVSLGVMAAGLMHELHNPGAAAQRAAAEMRENLFRLQQLSLRGAEEEPRTAEQRECLRNLLERIFSGRPLTVMSSIEQADAEEAMAIWLEQAGVLHANTLAAVLAAAGLTQGELACARVSFPERGFADAMNWLEALVANVTLVSTIEESMGRITDLVAAVKKSAYEDRAASREADVHDSVLSTLAILGHKLREKNLVVEKRFAASPAKIIACGPALGQVWTNLIDNAVDASPEGGTIEIATWSEPDALSVSIVDHGAGIAAEVLPHIFEPFFTTKPQGAGTGLGLEIVHRMVTQNLGGTIEVKSEPGRTQFLVRLRVNPHATRAIADSES